MPWTLFGLLCFLERVLMLLVGLLQKQFDISKPGPGERRWTPAFLLSCSMASVSVFCTCFGECLWKGSLTWVRTSRQLSSALPRL